MQPLPDITQMMRIAQSPAGQQLIAMLQKSDGTALQEAVRRATDGDYEGAKQILSSLLNGDESRALLRKLEENP